MTLVDLALELKTWVEPGAVSGVQYRKRINGGIKQ